MCDPFGDAGWWRGGVAGLRPAVIDVTPLWGVSKLFAPEMWIETSFIHSLRAVYPSCSSFSVLWHERGAMSLGTGFLPADFADTCYLETASTVTESIGFQSKH